ncbi:MAG: VanZ family protein [Muribaculaceae bacterium]|nr:VanZ family protein [Muribaculaceae bacterium]
MIKQIMLRLPQWLFSIIVLLAILYLTLVPKPLPDTNIRLFPHVDKVVHAIMFGGLYFCLVLDFLRNRALCHQSYIIPFSINITFFLSCIALGGLIELIQSWLGFGRSCDIYDFYADTAGVILFATFSKKVVCSWFK